MVIAVSLADQQLYVYRSGRLIGRSLISSGKRGHDTPTGVFPILQKNKDHRSNIYDNAPMPYMQRLTWDGVALHAGKLPGYPASHGCVRLPLAFARALFTATRMGVVVVVTGDSILDMGTGKAPENAPFDTSGMAVEQAQPGTAAPSTIKRTTVASAPAFPAFSDTLPPQLRSASFLSHD